MKIRKIVIVVVLALLVLCALTACDKTDHVFTDCAHFGSCLEVSLNCGDGTFIEFEKQAKEIIDEIASEFDENDVNSFLYKFNNADVNERVELSEITLYAYEVAKNAYDLTNGGYDPTVFYLSDLWGFTPRFNVSSFTPTEVYDRVKNDDGSFALPENKYVDEFKKLADFSAIKLENADGKHYLYKTESVTVDGVEYVQKIDYGGLVKGLVVEKLVDLCVNLDVTDGYVSYGSSSIYMFEYNGSDWTLMLANPRKTGQDDTVYYQTDVNNASASTSGDYERCYFIQDKRYSHIIDKTTGEPINNGVCAVTVIGATPSLGDCLATGLMINGADKIKQFAKSPYAVNNGIKIITAYEENGQLSTYSSDDGSFLLGENNE